MEYPYIDIHNHTEESPVPTITLAGIHPWQVEECELTSSEQRKALELEILEADAVGEIGLDFAAELDRDAQQRLFVAQLKLAKKCRRPVVLHCVKAFEATMHSLSTFPLEVIFHGFIGSVQQMNQAVEKGYYISFGERTFASPKTLKALRECPLDRLFIETDTAPISIEEIYAKISKHRFEDVDELREAIYNNYKRLFPNK